MKKANLRSFKNKKYCQKRAYYFERNIKIIF